MRINPTTTALIVALTGLLFCQKPPIENVKSIVAVTIPPQKYFVEKIAGDLVDVIVMVPPGASPHTYEPKPSQMASLSKATIYFAVGIELEKAWIGLLSKTCPAMTIVHTDSGIQKIASQDADDRGNGEGLDPHIWLSPELVRQQAGKITDALCHMDTGHASLFRKNDSLFMLQIDTLQRNIRRIFSSRMENKPFLVFHPAWGYFAKEFGLTQIAIEVNGKEPSPSELGAVFDIAKRDGIKTVYVQPQLSRRSAQIIAAEIGARVAVANDLAEDWAANLLRCAKALEDR